MTNQSYALTYEHKSGLVLVSPTIVIRDEREGLPCPSASLSQNMDPGYDTVDNNEVDEENIFQLSGYFQTDYIKITWAILLTNKIQSRAFCSLS